MFRMVGTLYFTDLHFAFTACYCEFILCAYKDSCIQTAQQLVGNNCQRGFGSVLCSVKLSGRKCLVFSMLVSALIHY